MTDNQGYRGQSPCGGGQGRTAYMPEAPRREDALGRLKKSAKRAFQTGAPGLERVERRMRDRLREQDSPFLAISDYLLDVGGKRIRPLVALLSARLFAMTEPSSALIDVAAGVELVHMATLLHDDIIDQSPVRRSRPSVFAKFGLSPTLLAGDFLLARAYGLCAGLDSFIIRETELACIALSEGELLEGKLSPGRPFGIGDYMEVVSKKTGALFALAALSGAHLAGADPEHVEALRRFGAMSGAAFQIVDDILDITADEDMLGKPPGIDLKQKTPSLVNVLWLAGGDSRAVDFFADPQPDCERCRDALAYLKKSPVLDQCALMARRQVEGAKEELLHLNLGRQADEAREQLCAVLEYIIERGL